MDYQKYKYTASTQEQDEVVHFRVFGSGITGPKQVFQRNSLPPNQLRQNRDGCDGKRAVQPSQVFTKNVAEQARHTQQAS